MRKNKNILLVLCFLVFLTSVGTAFAEVIINEIMYNPTGTDAKHEWIEIYNNGVITENLNGWKFNEESIDHALTLRQGDLTFSGGEYAIIADDADQFLLDYPTFTGTLFDSTFSLSNDGELIGIKDNLLIMRDSVTYSKDWNNNQEGKSIKKKNPLGDNSASNWQEGNSGGTPGKNNNAAPVVDPISAKDAIEDVDFNHPVEASDSDTAQQNLFISEPDSDLAWLTVDGTNKLFLIGKPTSADIGVQEIKVVVSDGVDKSAPVKFNLTVNPALEISSVKVNNQAWNGGKINVTPGEKVAIEYNFKNNHNTKNFGHVEASYWTSFGWGNFIECQGANCDDGYWSLNPGDTGKAVFTLELPFTDPGADQFELTLKAKYDQWWFFWGDNFYDEEKIDFNIIKENAAIHLENVFLYDTNLTCTRATGLDLTLINYGKAPVVPELLVYDRKPIVSSFDKVTGKFTQFDGQPKVKVGESLLPVSTDPNDQNQYQTKAINLSALSSGEHTLYIYLVNPYFDGSQKFIGDSAELKVKVGPCLNKTEIEKELVIAKNSNSAKEINLVAKDADGNYKYLIEDKDYDNSLRFGISDQTNDPLIFCSFNPNLQTLHCDAPKLSQDGNSELTLQIKETSVLDSLVEEKVKVTITPGMSLSNLKINSVSVNEGGDTSAFKPNEQLNVDYTLTNYLGHAITGIESKFVAQGINVVSKEKVNLKAGESKQLSLLVDLPYILATGKYSASLTAEGNDYNDPKIIQKEGYGFNLVIQQSPAEVEISKLSADDEGLVTCKSALGLKVELTNKGSNDEDDIAITVAGSKLNLIQDKILLAKSSKAIYTFSVPSGNLTSGANTLNVKISYRDGSNEDSETIVVQKKSCLKAFVPEKTNPVTADGKALDFEINLSETGFDQNIKWLVDGKLVSSGKKYSFVSNTVGEYSVKAVINDESHEWKVTVTNIPASSNFGTNLPKTATEDELKNFQDFAVWNSYGKIVFDGTTDLTNLFDLDTVIFIGDGKVAVDTGKAPELNKAATITLKKNYQNHRTLVSDKFNEGDLTEFDECPDTVCKAISNLNGEFVYTVTGFSTYWTVEEQPADFSVSEILAEKVERGGNATVSVTIKNSGTSDPLTGLKAEFYGVNSKYKTEIVGTLPGTLEAGKETKLDIKLTVPEDEDGGKHSIGYLKLVSNEKTKNAEIYLFPTDYLSVESLKVNGKSEGDLTLDEVNKIAVKVRNDDTEDLEDVTVNVKILDVDGDDLEEESDSFDLNAGDSESTTLEFDLSDEIIDEEEYTLEITVTGETEDGSEQEAIFTQTTTVAREKHKIIIKNTALSNNILSCDLCNTELDLTIENVGKNNEKDLVVKLENSDLGIDSAKEGIDLDKYSKDDNSESLAFSLDLEGAPAGTYPLDVKVYRGTHLEDSQTLNLVIEECLEEKEAELVQQQLAQESAKKLEQDLKAKQNQTASEIKSSFRDTKNYVLLLGVMMILAVIAICLGIAVMVKRKK